MAAKPLGPLGRASGTAPLEQINAEIFTMMYGSIVRQLITDLEDVEEVNKQLEQARACLRKSYCNWSDQGGYGLQITVGSGAEGEMDGAACRLQHSCCLLP